MNLSINRHVHNPLLHARLFFVSFPPNRPTLNHLTKYDQQILSTITLPLTECLTGIPSLLNSSSS